jgi:hypothetical protein
MQWPDDGGLKLDSAIGARRDYVSIQQYIL